MTAAGVITLLVSVSMSTAVLVLVVVALWFMDRYDREPIPLLLLVFGWGAVAAPLASVIIAGGASEIVSLRLGDGNPATLFISSVLLAPFVEEAVKGLALLAVFVGSRHFDNAADGMVYGTAVGIGFAVTENVLYALAGFTTLGASELLGLVVSRTLFSAGIHALASACFGGFLGHARLERRLPIRGLLIGLGLIAAMALHGCWNLVALRFLNEGAAAAMWLLPMLSLYLAFIGLFALFMALEHRILRRELEDEVALGTLPDWVVDIIPYYLRRIRAGWWPERSERTIICRLLTRLALRKHELRRVSPPAAELAGLEVVRIRGRIRSILAPVQND